MPATSEPKEPTLTESANIITARSELLAAFIALEHALEREEYSKQRAEEQAWWSEGWEFDAYLNDSEVIDDDNA